MNREQRRTAARSGRGARGPTVADLLGAGLDRHRAGDLTEAERQYRLVLVQHPDHPDALHLLGDLHARQGRLDLAVTSVRRAIAVRTDVADYHCTLGNVLADEGRVDEAVASYHRALDIDARHVGALNNLGNALRRLGHHDEAVATLQRALTVDALHVGAHNNMGIVLERLGRRDEAIDWYRRALALDPDYAPAQNNLGNALQADGANDAAIVELRRAVEIDPENVVALNNLAVALQESGEKEEAVAWYDRALAIEPDNLTGLLNLGRALRDLDRLADALVRLERARELAPNDPNVLINLGAALREANRSPEAIVHLERAATMVPDSSNALGNLAMAYLLTGRSRDSIDAYLEAIDRDPESPELRFSLSLALIADGAHRDGWELFDHGWKCQQRIQRDFGDIPSWRGEDLSGKKLIIWREQGLGDEILYASTYHDVIARAAEVVIDCEYRLINLFARSFPGALIRPVKQNTGAEGSEVPPPVAADYQVAAGSLMQWVRPDATDYPMHNSFLVADPDRVLFWAARLARLDPTPDAPTLKVGISWRSRSTSGLRGRWYTTLEQWEPIFSVPGVQFVNLQYDDCSAEVDEIRARYGIDIHGWDDIDLMADLDNVAALTTALDLVIGPANAVTAMSGALGVPTWQFDLPDDYSSLGMAGYLWLPAIRRFTKAHGEPWDETLASIGTSLRFVADRTHRRRSA